MGGKTSTSTQSVSIPPEVLARYRSVNARAEQVAETPFQSYSYDPSAFVAPLTPTQIAGIQNVNASQGMGYPFYQAGTQMTAAGAAPVGPITGTDIARYYNPFTAAVAAPTYEALRQQQAQEMQGATANAIRSGAFGGDRAGLVAANLARQQQLGTSQAMAPIFQQGYSQAQEAAQRQQQVDLQNQARMLQAGQQMAGLGTGVQQLGIGGGQAQLAAGTAEQQTQQAGLQALYNQFLQQVGYPFQVAQFLANIAMGTGALSGSTTTTTQPAPFFSDRREKTNVKKLGKGLYAFDYKDDVEAAEREGKPMPPKRVGPMAQEIEKDKPGMVIDVNDYKVVDPGREKAAYGGLMSFMNSLPQDLQQQSMGGGVTPEMAGQGFARGGYAVGGGMISDVEFRRLLAQQAQALGIYGANTTLGQGAPGGKGLFDPGRVQAPTRLATAPSAPRQQPSRMAELSQGLGQLTGKQGLGQSLEAIYDAGKRGLVGSPGRAATANAPAIEPSKGLIGSGGQFNRSGYLSSTGSDTANQPAAGATKPADASYKASIDEMPQGSQPLTGLGGLAQGDLPEMTDVMEAAYGGVARHGYATDGSVNEPDDDSPISAYRTPGPGLQIPDELKSKYEMLKPEKPPQQQSSGLGEVLGLAKMGAKIAMGMPPIFANGGVVPRSGYQSGGEPEPDPTLIQTESGGNFQAENQAVGSGGLRGHFGRLQFGQARLQDAIRAGVLPEGTTPQQFKASPDLQRETEKWHFKDIGNFIQQRGLDQSVGSEIAGIPVTQQGLINVAHLGGKGGLQKFIETGGRYNPEDENRTRLSDYLAMGAKNKGVVPNVPQEGAQTASQEGTTGETYNLARPPQRGVAAGIAPPKSLEGKEQSWGDFLTSRQFVVPFLSGLGAMASSPSRYLGSAVLQGLGAGAKSFEELEKMEAEKGRIRAETETEAQRPAYVRMQTRAVEAGLYERKWIPGVGWFVIDKSNPKSLMQITDANLNPLPGTNPSLLTAPVESGSKNAPGADMGGKPKPVQADTTAAPQGTPAPSAPPPVPSQTGIQPPMKEQVSMEKAFPQPKNVSSWTPTTKVPQGYLPKEHLNIAMDEETKKRNMESATKITDEQARKAEAAYKQIYVLDQMNDQLNQLPKTGFLAPGSFAPQRKEIAERTNFMLQALGGRPLFDPNNIAAMESLTKDTFRLGAALANSIGSREPGFIVQQSVTANPGIGNTRLGFQRISAGLREAAKYEQDKNLFYQDYFTRFGHLAGAEESFRRANPERMYVDRAIVSTVDPRDVDALRNAPKEKKSAWISAIDKKYGSGVANKVLGE